MFSLLSNSELSPAPCSIGPHIEQPLKIAIDADTMRLPNGVQVAGSFKDGKVDGEFELQFPGGGTRIQGTAKGNMLVGGVITFDTGLVVEGQFQNNGTDDVYKDVVVRFKSGVAVRASYEVTGRLVEAALYGLEGELITRYNGSAIVFYLDKGQGVIISESLLYEGELQGDQMTGTGVEYYPVGLGYYLIESTDQTAGKLRTRAFCYFKDEQYTAEFEYMRDALLSGTRLYGNGLAEQTYSLCGETRSVLSFEKFGYEGVVETGPHKSGINTPRKGTFVYRNTRLDVEYELRKNGLFIGYEGAEYELHAFFARFLKDVNLSLREIKEDADLYVTVKKPLRSCRSPKDCDGLREQFEGLKEKTECLLEKKEGDRAALANAQNLIGVLYAQLEQQSNELRSFKAIESSTATTSQAKFFSGSKVGGLNQGYCVEITQDNHYYEGEYHKGYLQGRGTLKTEEFEYTGEFRNNRPHGVGEKRYTGKKKWLKGQFFEGNYTGTTIAVDKLVYHGDIRNDCMNGRGRLVFTNDWELDGIFQEDEIVKGKEAGRLTNINSGHSFLVEYKYVAELAKNVLVTAGGVVYGIETSTGALKKLF